MVVRTGLWSPGRISIWVRAVAAKKQSRQRSRSEDLVFTHGSSPEVGSCSKDRRHTSDRCQEGKDHLTESRYREGLDTENYRPRMNRIDTGPRPNLGFLLPKRNHCHETYRLPSEPTSSVIALGRQKPIGLSAKCASGFYPYRQPVEVPSCGPMESRRCPRLRRVRLSRSAPMT